MIAALRKAIGQAHERGEQTMTIAVEQLVQLIAAYDWLHEGCVLGLRRIESDVESGKRKSADGDYLRTALQRANELR